MTGLTQLIMILSPVISAILGYIGGHKAKSLENKRTEIDIYQDIITDLEKRVKDRDESLDGLRVKLDQILQQNRELITKVTQLEKDYTALSKNYKNLEVKYREAKNNKNTQNEQN